MSIQHLDIQYHEGQMLVFPDSKEEYDLGEIVYVRAYSSADGVMLWAVSDTYHTHYRTYKFHMPFRRTFMALRKYVFEMNSRPMKVHDLKNLVDMLGNVNRIAAGEVEADEA